MPSAGIPRKYILRYSAAPSISSSLVFMTSRITLENTSPNSRRITPMSAHIHAAECTTSRTSLFFFAPMYCAVITFTPPDTPIKNVVNSVTSVVVEPTLPSACEPANCPTTAMSDMLKSTCKRFDSTSGMLNTRICFARGPFVKSLLTFFSLLLML